MRLAQDFYDLNSKWLTFFVRLEIHHAFSAVVGAQHVAPLQFIAHAFNEFLDSSDHKGRELESNPSEPTICTGLETER